METPKPKPKPNNKRKTIQITYPAPYSLSWTPDVQPVLMKNKVGRSTSLFHRSKRPPVSTRAWSQEFPSGRPDRTAAHLKYGVFRNRRGGAPPKPMPNVNTFPKIDRLKRLPVKRNKPAAQVSKPPQSVISKISTITPMKPFGNELPPKLAVRNKDKNCSKKLSVSKVSHWDIKPDDAASHTPSFCPAPTFKTLPRKLTLTPTKYRSKEFV